MQMVPTQGTRVAAHAMFDAPVAKMMAANGLQL
jgi:hypothetical protein